MNRPLDELRSLRVAAEPPPMETVLAGARHRLHRRRRIRSLAGSAAGFAMAALLVLTPSAMRSTVPVDELNGELCAPLVCTAAWSPVSQMESDPLALCGLHEIACLAESERSW